MIEKICNKFWEIFHRALSVFSNWNQYSRNDLLRDFFGSPIYHVFKEKHENPREDTWTIYNDLMMQGFIIKSYRGLNERVNNTFLGGSRL